MGRWLRRWLKRAFGVCLCAASWMFAVGVLSLGPEWFHDQIAIRDAGDLLLNSVVYVGGTWGGAAFFFALGPFVLWVFWSETT